MKFHRNVEENLGEFDIKWLCQKNPRKVSRVYEWDFRKKYGKFEASFGDNIRNAEKLRKYFYIAVSI